MSGEAPAAARPLQVGINLDGVLVHDGMMTPLAQTRLAWVQHSGAFDYIEKNIDPTEDFTPYFKWVQQYGVPIGVFGGIFCAGQDEHRMRWGLRTGGQLGAKVFNMQLYARHCDGHTVSDRAVADFFLQAMEHGTQSGCLPSLEVHVDMWSERFERIEAVANLLAQSHVDLRLTLDHSHLIFKIDNAEELALSGVDAGSDGGRSRLAPNNPQAFYTQWLSAGWVVHAHARSVATGLAGNPRGKRSRDVQGRAIQHPFVAPGAGQFHGDWQEAQLQDWKTAVRELLLHMQQQPERAPQRISCEFIPFADYGGGARYSIWDCNRACADWLRAEWAALQSAPL
jgi:hypothetical protein